VVDEAALTDHRARMYLNARPKSRGLRDDAREQFRVVRVEPMRGMMPQKSAHSGVAEQYFYRRPRRRIPVDRGFNISRYIAEKAHFSPYHDATHPAIYPRRFALQQNTQTNACLKIIYYFCIEYKRDGSRNTQK
jgi:hypothetical protein